MNEEIDESEFYHQDFTTASEWEIFVARIEEIIHQWKVEDQKSDGDCDPDISEGSWRIRDEKVQFVDVEFILSHLYNTAVSNITLDDEEDPKKRKSPLDTYHDFSLENGTNRNQNLALAVWYGLNEFITLTPLGSSGITSESQIKLLLSSAQLAISNTNCHVPVFVQIREKWQRCFLGICEGEGVRTNFEMIHLRRGPQHCQYLTGLLDLFKTKIMSPISLDPITISVQFTYQLSDFGNSTWKQELPDLDHENCDIGSLSVLPFGVSFDPVNVIVLKTAWSHLPDHLIVDSENYSDFDPLQAPKWTVLVKMSDQPLCLLSECMTEILHLFSNNSTMYDVLGDFATADHDTENPLDLLTESKLPTISNVLKRAARNSLTKTRKGVAPLSEDVLVPILYYLFPDADEEVMYPYNEKLSNNCNDSSEMSSSIIASGIEEQCRGFKTCVEESLPWRLAVILAHALVTLGGVRAFSHLWFEFAQEMRYRWEKSIVIPGLAPGFPDPRTCLLHQKLQMLNCCIERKKAREAREAGSKQQGESQRSDESSGTDDDEFFDCSPDKPEEEEQQARRKPKHSLWNQPVGRLGKFGTLKLIKNGDPLYIPVTQEPVPKTEDQLEEDTDVLLQLGSDAQGTELRAKMMSASLLSDMESFKAANPGSILEDFIRWYSPRDWIEEDLDLDEWGQKKGHLSSRMLISDNTWVQMWESAKPVPANRQKRLFDDTREAEKVLHFLDSRTLAQIAEMVFAVLAHSSICRLNEECDQASAALPEAAKALGHIIKVVEQVSRDCKVSARRYEALVQEMTTLELLLSQANSLLYKFNPSGETDEKLSALVGRLVAGGEVEIEGKGKSAIGNKIMGMFSDAQKAANMILTSEQGAQDNSNSGGGGGGTMGNVIFPRATEREFVMRVSAVRPAPYSAKCPQFLRAVLSRNEFRLAGAFSEDIVFF